MLLGILGGVSAVVFVEGESDRAALEALAERLGRDLDAEAVVIVSMNGASSLGDHISEVLESAQPGTTLAGLCDEDDAYQFCWAAESVGLGANLSVSGADVRRWSPVQEAAISSAESPGRIVPPRVTWA